MPVCIYPYPTSVAGGTGKRRLGVGGHALVSGCQNIALPNRNITMHARPMRDRRTDEHNGSSAAIRSNERVAR